MRFGSSLPLLVWYRDVSFGEEKCSDFDQENFIDQNCSTVENIVMVCCVSGFFRILVCFMKILAFLIHGFNQCMVKDCVAIGQKVRVELTKPIVNDIYSTSFTHGG